MAKAIQSVLTKILAAALSLAAVCCVAACGGEKPSDEKMEISLSKTEVELYEGESVRLTVTVSPADAKDKHVEWRVSDPMVVSVEDGVVTGKKAGETVVTAHAGDKTATCKVKVKPKEDSSGSSSDSGNSSSGGSESGSSSSGGSSEESSGS